MNGIELYREF